MMKQMVSIGMLALTLCVAGFATQAKGDNFGDVVKVIECHYNVKHKGIPFLARAGMKTAVVAARIAGGPKKRLAEAGSVKVAYFEDQDFNSPGGASSLKAAINATLGASWHPLVQVSSPQNGEHVSIFLRDRGEKFDVLVITVERRDASVVQVTLSPSALAKLLQDPNEMGAAINAEASEDQ
jgi:hypothetical protein